MDDVPDCTLSEAAEALRLGKPVVFPTDTVYGLGVSVCHAPAPDILYEIKHRDERKPIAWLVGGVDDLERYGVDVPQYAQDLARAFWPGPLTLIVKASDKVPKAFRSAAGTIALRCPKNMTALDLISRVGCPLATTSANVSGSVAPWHFASLDGEVLSRVGAAVSDDSEKSGVASTIVDCTGDEPVVIRRGPLDLAGKR